METLKNQYENSAQIRRGIDTVLKSPNYTEEYKDRIRRHLNADSTDIFDVSGSLMVREGEDVNEIIISTRNGSSTGWVERAIYIQDELIRALDTDVDELIPAPPKDRIETVPKAVYDAKVQEFNDLVEQLAAKEAELQAALSEIDTLKGEIASLLQALDAEKLQTAAASNEAQAANSRFQSLLGDFQEALQKGIQEAIERVSLEAQVRGLQAQKEVLLAQVASLIETVKALQGNIEALQGQIEFQQEQLTIQAEQFTTQQQQQAAQLLLSGINNQSAIGSSGQSGWKVPSVGKPGDMEKGQTLRYEDDDGNRRWVNGPEITLYNISEVPLTFQFRFQVDFSDDGGFLSSQTTSRNPWVGGQSVVIVPPRVGSQPGTFTYSAIYTGAFNGKGKNSDYGDKILVSVSNGDSFEINAHYFYDR